VFSFYPTDSASSRHKTVSINSQFNPMHWFSWTWFAGSVCCIKFFPLYFSFRFLRALSQFYCILPCSLYSTKPGLRYLYSCSYTKMSCSVPGGITGPPCSWGIQIRRPGPPGWESLESETVKCGHESRGALTSE
jgi:hypothetical protein